MHRLLHRLMRHRLVAMLVVCLTAVAGVTLLGVVTGRIGIESTHGVSMNPVYYQGDLVIVAKQHSYAVGDIVAYHLASAHHVVLHRIIHGNTKSFAI